MKMKICFAGSFKYYFYDEVCVQALEHLGCDVMRFAWQAYYGSGLLSTVQQRFLLGYGIFKLNKDFIDCIKKNKPDVVYINRGVPIWPITLKKIKRYTNSTLVSNNNDDPFGQAKGMRLWSHFVRGIPLYDLNFVYRPCNIEEYFNYGARRVEVLMPYYVPQLHYPIQHNENDRKNYACDIAFVGHGKKDDRLKHLECLAKAGYDFHLYGWHWDRLSRKLSWLRGHYSPPVWELDYTRTISKARIALIFFTRANRDTYTRRSFEIPAIGTCMLSERTQDMLELFREDVEAVYFSSTEELLKKVDWLLNNENERLKIAEKAMDRIKKLKASVHDRMMQALTTIQELIP